MKITVEFLSLPKLTRIFGKKSIEFDFPGRTIAELIEYLARTGGPEAGRFLLDESGRFDMHFRLLLNEQEWITSETMDRQLAEGDKLRIMMLVGGG